jgi:biopolymer transport protein ExbD
MYWVFLAIGALFLAGAVLNWKWVFEVGRLRWVTYLFGEKAGRIIYGVCGALFLAAALFLIVRTGGQPQRLPAQLRPAPQQEGVDVSLPRADGRTLPLNKNSFYLTLDAFGNVYIAGKRLTPEEMEAHLPVLLKGREKEILTINGSGVPYDKLMKVIAVVKRSGVEKINLAVKPNALAE